MACCEHGNNYGGAGTALATYTETPGQVDRTPCSYDNVGWYPSVPEDIIPKSKEPFYIQAQKGKKKGKTKKY